MPLYPFEMQIAVDANNPGTVVQEGVVTISDPGDSSNTPLTILTPLGLPMANPIRTSRQGFIPAFQATIPQIKWSDGNYAGYLSSSKGLLDEAIAARQAAETASISNLPAGGTAGQVLTKASDTNGDTRWGDATGGGGTGLMGPPGPKGDKGATGATGATGPAGATTLAGMTDAVISAPANRDALVYDSATSKWKNVPSQRVDTTAGRAVYVWDNVNNREQLAFGDTGYRALCTWTTAGVITGGTTGGGGSTGSSNKTLGVYWTGWGAPGNMTNVDTDYNLIYVFAATRAEGTGNLSWPYAMPVGLQEARARGQKVILSTGGAGQAIAFNSRTISQQFVTTFQTVASSMGGVDGIDFNTFEGGVSPNLTEYRWMASEFKRIYGPNFIVTSPPAPWSTVDMDFCRAMLASGHMDFCSPQYYDGPGMAEKSYVVSNVAEWITSVAAGDASKIAVGFGVANAQNYMTNAVAIDTFQTIKANHPNIRGAFLWERAADAAQNWAFANAMGPLVGAGGGGGGTTGMPATIVGFAPTAGVAGGIYLRRLNNMIQFSIHGATTTAAGQSIAIPAGFQPGGAPYPTIIMVCTVGTTLTMASSAVGMTDLWMSFPNAAKVPNGGADYGSMATWTTQQRWPTTLPGTAVGTIPY